MKKIITLGVVGLVLGLASVCFAATIRIAATVVQSHQMNVTLSRIASVGATPTLVTDLTGAGMDFGTLVKGTDTNLRSPVYFYIDAPVVSNKPGWTITHTATDFANGAVNLNLNTNVTFMKVSNLDNSETALAGNYTSYATAKTRAPIAQSTLTDGRLRIYYGLANGSGDATGVVLIPSSQAVGSYVGTVTLTLSS